VATPIAFQETDQSRRLRRAGLWLEWATVGWNSIEALVAVGAGVFAGSIALIGFGMDSVIESLSGAVLVWRLMGHTQDERRDRIALRLVGLSFLALGFYVGTDASRSLLSHETPDASLPGIIIAALSLIVMPLLAAAKRRVARRIDSAAMAADARQTDICAYLSVILLAGLGANAWVGWWWADPVAALAMVPIIVREGVMAVRGKSCGCSSAH
jgi:divalent metal cation (Fe/Co/Zn/Cd) transporter